MITPETSTPSTVTECSHDKGNAFHKEWIKSFGECWEEVQGLPEHDQEGTPPWTTLRDLSQDPS